MFIRPDGRHVPWQRTGRPRIHEQAVFLRQAARLGAQAAVVECMALDPVLQWVAEHQLIRSHIGVITNVRTDHLEQMGAHKQQIARSLANTIPRAGVLVTGDRRFYPLFSQLAQPLGTRVVLARADEWKVAFEKTAAQGFRIDTPFAENVAIACTAVREAGYGHEQVAQLIPALYKDAPSLPLQPLTRDGGAEGPILVHRWAINDPESYVAFVTSDLMPIGIQVPLFNHRADRPLRAVAFARLFSGTQPPLARILVTGDYGVEPLFVRGGIARERIVRVPFPPTLPAIREAIKDLPGRVVVVGCGNARGVASLEQKVRHATADTRMEELA